MQVWVCMHECMYVYKRIYVYVCMVVSLYLYVYVYVGVDVCVGVLRSVFNIYLYLFVCSVACYSILGPFGEIRIVAGDPYQFV